jgi:hypothetical protein
VLKARQDADFGHQSHGGGELDTTEGLQRLDHRLQTPRFHVLAECLVETLAAFGVVMNRTDVFLKDDGFRRGGTDHCREPSEVGRVPISEVVMSRRLEKQR